MFELSDTDLRRLVHYVIQHRGPDLCRSDFTEHVLNLFEDIPGLELLSSQTNLDYLNILWSLYRDYLDRNR